MTKGLKKEELNGRKAYPDIIDHPHWQSPVRPHMSLDDRAAQFSSFDALTGYSDMVKEEQRLTDAQIELDEETEETLNRTLLMITDLLKEGQHPVCTITWFEPDALKAGGKYVTATEEIKKIDKTSRRIVLAKKSGYAGSNQTIDFDKILAVTIL